MENRYFGTDPEFFVYENYKNTECGNLVNIIPPASLIQDLQFQYTTTKNNKRCLFETGDYKIIEDGSALEFNFKIPFKNSAELYSTYQNAKSNAKRLLSSHDYSLKLSSDILGYFSTKDYWENRDESFIDAVRFGCDPDVFPSIYLLMGFEQDTCKITDASKHEYRYCGGHLHIQNMSKDSKVYVNNLEYASIVLDFILGTTNVCLERNYIIKQQELARLKYYGRPGRVRIQKYTDKINGIEYRPPSNYWLQDMYTVNVMINSASIAGNIIEREKSKDFYNEFKDRITEMWDALTFHNKELASEILSDALIWSLNNNLVTIKEMEEVYGRL